MYDKFWFLQREKRLKDIQFFGYSPLIYQSIIASHYELQRSYKADR
jgi:hypothetical protein